MKRPAAKIEQLLTEIAREYLKLETLKARSSDSLDFKEQSVWAIRDALRAAYDHGVVDGMQHAMDFLEGDRS